jgi:hypothetical protein
MISTPWFGGAVIRTHSEEAMPTPEGVQKQALHVAESQGFRSSDPVRNLLLFLAQHYRENPGQPVKEYELATRALGLDDSYDSSTDSTVRVAASRLRGKLAEYYTHEGAQDSIVLDVPKGAYVLSAVCRVSPRSEPPREKAARASWFGWRTLLVVGILVCVTAVGYLAGHWVSHPQIPASTRTFWTHFAGQSPGVLIVFANPRFAGVPETGMRLMKERSGTSGPVMDVYTGTGEVLAVWALTQQLDRFGVKAQVKRCLLFTWDEARSNDLIFVGGRSQNFALSQLPRLEKFNFETSEEASHPPQSVLRNEKPLPGEEARYVSSYVWTDGSEYAVVALTPGVSPERKVLILHGASTFGTEAAAGFVCSPARLNELLSRLHVSPGGKVPTFEALLKLDVRGGAPSEPRLELVYRRSDASGAAN